MEASSLIESFSEFAKQKSIDRPTMIKILEDVFRAMIRKKYESDENFDIIINTDKVDLEIWRSREIVDDEFAEDSFDFDPNKHISLTEARLVEKDFENPENPDSKVLDLKNLAKAKVELKSTDDKVIATTTTDTAGKFVFKLDAETDYKLTASRGGYFSNNSFVSTVGKRHQDSTIIRIYTQIEFCTPVYVVCPLIAENDSLGLKSVETEVEILRKDHFKNRRIAMLHGKLKPQEKENILQAFATGEYDILVSTTVVEVGINVVNATVMLVEGCERFGLAQLHQLRGRVGRAADQSYCYLFPTNDEKISKRLKAITTTNDGFKLAEMDLELRGAGSLFGFRQHGDLDLRFSNLTDVNLIKKAQKAVHDFIETDDLLKYKELNIMAQKARTIKQLN